MMIKLNEIKNNLFIPFKDILYIICKKYNCSLHNIKKIISLNKYNYIIILEDYKEYLLTIDDKNTSCGELIIKDYKINVYTIYD